MDFEYLKLGKKWVILAPRRSKRPDIATGIEPVCPFCPGKEGEEEEVYRIPVTASAAKPGTIRYLAKQSQEIASGSTNPRNDIESIPRNDNNDWLVRVLPNKFPFAPIHEVIIHSPDHHKNFGELPVGQVELILQTNRQRYQTHKLKGQVYIFHNRGKEGGESLPHPHSQLAVIPNEVEMDIPTLNSVIARTSPKARTKQSLVGVATGFANPRDDNGRNDNVGESVETAHFSIFCPKSSQWPDEVWIAPKVRQRTFGDITDEEISDLADILTRIIKILSLRHSSGHRDPAQREKRSIVLRLLRRPSTLLRTPRNDNKIGQEFPFNFYIYPGVDWYLRIIPRLKTLGGFELGTGIYINTQDPSETIAFIREHFENPDVEKIKTVHKAEYEKRV